jgi:toxin HigB-1
MIRSFRSRALTAFWHRGDASKIRPDHFKRLRLRLARLDAALQAAEMNVAEFNFHRLRGNPPRYTVHINGPWCLTFEWENEDAIRVDLERYH